MISWKWCNPSVEELICVSYDGLWQLDPIKINRSWFFSSSSSLFFDSLFGIDFFLLCWYLLFSLPVHVRWFCSTWKKSPFPASNHYDKFLLFCVLIFKTFFLLFKSIAKFFIVNFFLYYYGNHRYPLWISLYAAQLQNELIIIISKYYAVSIWLHNKIRYLSQFG